MTTLTDTAFASLIRTARDAAGLTQADLAGLTGVSRSTLIRWESGRADKPEPEHIRAVCAALNIPALSATDALGLTDPKEREVSVHDDGALATLTNAAAAGRIRLSDVDAAKLDGFLRGVEVGERR